MSNLRKIIAKNLVELRKQHNFTQSELAAMLKYSDKAISKWESGESLPDVEVLYDICKIYNISFEYILIEGDKKSKQNLVYKSNSVNKAIISLLSITLVWFTILLIYIFINVVNSQNIWPLFVWGCPLSALLALIFNSIWGRRRLNYLIISIMIWTFLAATFTSFILANYYFWQIFLLGIPSQIAIILWSKLK